jgi:hypothetical protein
LGAMCQLRLTRIFEISIKLLILLHPMTIS